MLDVTVERNDFAAIANQLVNGVEAAVTKAAFDIQDRAQTVVPVDTGNLKNSIHVEQDGPFAAAVLTDVHYAIYVEFGTYKMAARPYLTPSVEAARPAFQQAMAQAMQV